MPYSQGDTCPECKEGQLEKLKPGGSYLQCDNSDCEEVLNEDGNESDLESDVMLG